jgi:hypothetical protein
MYRDGTYGLIGWIDLDPDGAAERVFLTRERSPSSDRSAA